jgi:hypothetical protein
MFAMSGSWNVTRTAIWTFFRSFRSSHPARCNAESSEEVNEMKLVWSKVPIAEMKDKRLPETL